MNGVMAETITHTWQTVEQAAVTMNVSTRTVARRLANNTLESRVDENGRRLVLVQQVLPAATELAETEPDVLAPAVEGTMSVPHEQAVTVLTVLQTTLSAARHDAQTARRSAKWAWAGVAFVAVAALAGATVVSSLLTRATVTQDLLGTQLAETKTELKQTQAELIATRSSQAVTASKLTDAQAAADKAREVELARPAQPTITGVTNAAAPTTRPSLIDRVASLLGN